MSSLLLSGNNLPIVARFKPVTSMRVLDSVWMQNCPQMHPYLWLATEPGELFAAGVAEELSRTFPMDSFTRVDAGERRTDKTYRNYSRTLAAPGRATDWDLPAGWRDLLSDLLSPEYRSGIARMFGQAVAEGIEIRLVRHAPDDWLSAHTDRPDKMFSQIFYFNPDWREEWGGSLEILEGNEADAVAARIVPRLGASALLARSHASWHQVSRITALDAPERRSLLVHGLCA